MKTIMNTNNVDTTQQPIFLGESLGLQRYDRFKYQIFFDLFNKQMQLFWRPEEISLSKDRNDYETLQDHEKHIFTSNLLFQTMLDSVVSRGVPSFTQYVTNPELEACLTTWGFFETIHSYSYTYIIKNLYHNPSEVLDRALTDKEIQKRANSVSKTYNELNAATKDNVKARIYMGLISVNILEAIRFYVSFACAFAFAENKKMIGNADIIKLIKRDEAVHLYITQNILNILRREKSEGFQEIIKEHEDLAIKAFVDGANEEKEWASYLFKDGSILGLNENLLFNYIEWLTDSRMQVLGLPKQFNVKNNLGTWLDAWMSSEKVQVAPQESEITSYKIGASKNDVSDVDLSEFKL